MNNYQERYTFYKDLIEDKLISFTTKTSPEGIYSPMKYVLEGGGKRIRPMLLILCCEAAGGDAKNAINAAAAIEILHNFTLVHDDIMDNADTRRGRLTVHKKWDRDTAILAGDGMIGFAYKILLQTDSPKIREISLSFTEAIIEVCEGQSYDKEFESRKKVSIDEYLMMIEKKTSVLLKCCAEIGGLIGGGTNEEINALNSFCLNMGLAFQIQDDLLDIIADEKKFGKRIGGDLMEGKKTFLLLKAIEKATHPADIELLHSVIENKGVKDENDISKIKDIYEHIGVMKDAADAVSFYTKKSIEFLNTLKDSEAKNMLKWFSEMLLKRTS